MCKNITNITLEIIILVVVKTTTIHTDLIMRKITLLLLMLHLTANQSIYAQQSSNASENITFHLENYFAQERENIHLHLNKDVYLTNESVWFKGYVFERKGSIPFLYTTNVFAALIDQEGNKLEEKLLFASNGLFTGNFDLNEKYKSGIYYIQVYTNWMNNFSEDESSLYKINIINEVAPAFTKYTTPNLSQINIELHPEGGNFIRGILNTVGIKISDCNGNPVALGEGILIDREGKGDRRVLINKFGVGKFDIIPDGTPYKLRFNNNGTVVEANLPPIQIDGVALEVNNFALTNKTIVKIRTTKGLIATLGDAKKAILVIHQDNKANYVDIDFSDQQTNKEFVLSNDNLYPGINIIRIVDANLNELAQRIIFKYPAQKPEILLTANRKPNKEVVFSGQTNLVSSNLSISVLPEKTIGIFENNDIYGSFLIDPYLNQKISNARYYLAEYSKARHYELDLYLLNQKSSKSNWKDIVSNPPAMTHEFDTGLTIRGKLLDDVSDSDKYKVKGFSFLGRINVFSDLNENLEFQFTNLVLADSSVFNFGMIKMPDMNKVLPTETLSKVTNSKRTFSKSYKPQFRACPSPIAAEITLDLPAFPKNVILLEEVDVVGEKKNILSHADDFGNVHLRGEKIGDRYAGMNVTDYIRNNGFNVSTENGQISITGRAVTSFMGPRASPAVFIDERKLFHFDELFGLRMGEIDEIYLSTQAVVPMSPGSIGIIKIYMKENKGVYKPKVLSKSLVVDGFEVNQPFVNAEYSSAINKGFENFGVLHWEPNIQANETGSFDFEMPETDFKTVKVLIEGLSPDGRMISEIRTIIIN